MKLLKVLPMALVFLGLGCSDEGDKAPTDSGTAVTVSVDDVEALEGSVASFTVRLSRTTTSDVTFDYATSDNSASSGQGGDYSGGSGTGTIPAGATGTTVNINTLNDSAIELPETFTFTISSPTNAGLGNGNATATIWDNDGASFATQIRPIILSSGCLNSGCHGTGSSSGELSMGTGTYGSVTNARGSRGDIVVPQRSDRSNFYLKLLDPPSFGSRMPLGGPFLSPTNINLIRDWIDQGAQNN